MPLLTVNHRTVPLPMVDMIATVGIHRCNDRCTRGFRGSPPAALLLKGHIPVVRRVCILHGAEKKRPDDWVGINLARDTVAQLSKAHVVSTGGPRVSLYEETVPLAAK